MEIPQPGWRRLWAIPPAWRQAILIALAFLALAIFYLAARLTSDLPVTHDTPVEHFKYGSTGGERASGIPYAVWKVLPRLFREYLPSGRYRPGQEYAAFGFLYEGDKDLPIGVSRRTVQGLPRVFLNCAICHVGSVRFAPGEARKLVVGMPSNTVDLEAFLRFLLRCAGDERFYPDRVLHEIEALPRETPAGIAAADRLDSMNRVLLRYLGFPRMRDRLLMLTHRLRYMDMEPDFGPGRVDTFSPAKVLENFPLDKLFPRELGGTADLPSIWQQGKRTHMLLHWDGNNDKMQERDRNAAFGTGAFPPTLDRPSLERMETFIAALEPPAFPPERIDQGKAARGKPIYERYCADCHGRSGRDFAGTRVGQVTSIDRIGTDRRRLDSYTYELSVVQNSIYAGYGDERYSHFRKTNGYVNMPLDGIWLRAPYLHNGSVPTLRDLLEKPADRPKVFYRGYDLYDFENVGFVSKYDRKGKDDAFDESGHSLLEKDDPRSYFRQAVLCSDAPGQCDRRLVGCTTSDGTAVVCGNGNGGHEGKTYGTELDRHEKDALIEYLKTF